MVHESNKQHLSQDTKGTIVNKKTVQYITEDPAAAVWGMDELRMSTDSGGIFSEINMTVWRRKRNWRERISGRDPSTYFNCLGINL